MVAEIVKEFSEVVVVVDRDFETLLGEVLKDLVMWMRFVGGGVPEVV